MEIQANPTISVERPPGGIAPEVEAGGRFGKLVRGVGPKILKGSLVVGTLLDLWTIYQAGSEYKGKKDAEAGEKGAKEILEAQQGKADQFIQDGKLTVDFNPLYNLKGEIEVLNKNIELSIDQIKDYGSWAEEFVEKYAKEASDPLQGMCDDKEYADITNFYGRINEKLSTEAAAVLSELQTAGGLVRACNSIAEVDRALILYNSAKGKASRIQMDFKDLKLDELTELLKKRIPAIRKAKDILTNFTKVKVALKDYLEMTLKDAREIRSAHKSAMDKLKAFNTLWNAIKIRLTAFKGLAKAPSSIKKIEELEKKLNGISPPVVERTKENIDGWGDKGVEKVKKAQLKLASQKAEIERRIGLCEGMIQYGERIYNEISKSLRDLNNYDWIPASAAACRQKLKPQPVNPLVIAPPCNYTYSGWTPCQPDNTMRRTVTGKNPPGCRENPPPVLIWPCKFVAPPKPTKTISGIAFGCEPRIIKADQGGKSVCSLVILFSNGDIEDVSGKATWKPGPIIKVKPGSEPKTIDVSCTFLGSNLTEQVKVVGKKYDPRSDPSVTAAGGVTGSPIPPEIVQGYIDKFGKDQFAGLDQKTQAATKPQTPVPIPQEYLKPPEPPQPPPEQPGTGTTPGEGTNTGGGSTTTGGGSSTTGGDKPTETVIDTSGPWTLTWTWSVTSVTFSGTLSGGPAQWQFQGTLEGGGNAVWSPKKGSGQVRCSLSGSPDKSSSKGKISCSATIVESKPWSGQAEGTFSLSSPKAGKSKFSFRGRGKGIGGEGKPSDIDELSIKPK